MSSWPMAPTLAHLAPAWPAGRLQPAAASASATTIGTMNLRLRVRSAMSFSHSLASGRR